MKWSVKNHLGEVVTWYSEDVIEKIREIANKILLQTNEYHDCYEKDECDKCKRECQYKMVEKILQIIEK